MDRIAIDAASAVPPFEQLRAQVAALVAAGDLSPAAGSARCGRPRPTSASR